MEVIVLKFGGTSVRFGTSHITNIINKNLKEGKLPIVVLSALNKITDLLIQITYSSINNSNTMKEEYDEIYKIHQEIMGNNNFTSNEISKINNILDELFNILSSLQILKVFNKEIIDKVVSYGEILSTEIYSIIINKSITEYTCNIVNFNKLITIDADTQDVLFEKSKENIDNILIPLVKKNIIPIIGGFNCLDNNNKINNLGRGGSDYTATIIAGLLESVKKVIIYTDVNGIKTSDPKKVKNSTIIKEINIDEIKELAYFGAKIIHPKTMIPLIKEKKDMYIANTFDPFGDMTRIIYNNKSRNNNFLSALSSLNSCSLINIYGPGMIGKIGILGNIINEISKLNINIPFITQASSEQSICICIPSDSVDDVMKNLNKYLNFDIKNNNIEYIKLKNDISIITTVGNKMINNPGTAGKIFTLLGNENINILAISQGSTENSISFIVDEKNEITTLNILHNLIN